MRLLTHIALLLAGIWTMLPGAVRAADFVLLSDLAPGIVQSMRYATPVNFTGARVPGYKTATCILTRPTAEALAAVQEQLEMQGLGLVVFDCYRPERAVAAFVDWSRKPGIDDDRAKQFFAPAVPARRLFAQGYIATRSGHSRGHTVDLGLITLGAMPPLPTTLPAGDCTSPQDAADGLLDMGSSFDCLDRKSWFGAKGVTGTQARNRDTLRAAMIAAGFSPYEKEWWHYSYPPGDSGSGFDFPVDPAALPAGD